jgi:hypothetical protein
MSPIGTYADIRSPLSALEGKADIAAQGRYVG